MTVLGRACPNRDIQFVQRRDDLSRANLDYQSRNCMYAVYLKVPMIGIHYGRLFNTKTIYRNEGQLFRDFLYNVSASVGFIIFFFLFFFQRYRGTFYLEEAVASSQGFYCPSRVM
ncbi:hypothetical protein PUN28_000665 [Cardiocondyla obscurior]|uniref:Uncharacterized protein n=1 Tax=Cardiocondyla obscurior TaxID=286306 RepID=A0AAW2H100_9HYME